MKKNFNIEKRNFCFKKSAIESVIQTHVIKKVFQIFFLLCLGYGSFAQKKDEDFYDSIRSRYKNYYTLGNLQISNNGRFAAIKRMYTGNKDTILIVDRTKPGKPVQQLIRKNKYLSFLVNDRILSLGNGDAELTDLKNMKTQKWSGVGEVAVLEKKGHYIIHCNDRRLKVFDGKDNQVADIENVKSFVSDKAEHVFALTENGNKKEIIAFSSGRLRKVYETDAEIKRVYLSESSSHLIIQGLKSDKMMKMTFIDTEMFKASSFEMDSSENLITVKEWESGDAQTYLIDVQTKVPEEKTVPEIWYANDGNLKAKSENIVVKHSYYRWNIDGKTLDKIPDDSFPLFVPTNNKQFLMAFDPYSNYRYNTRYPILEIYLYDIVNRKYMKVLENCEDLMVSPKGKYLLSFDFTAKQWIGKEVGSERTFQIPKNLKSRPVFDEDEKIAWFESSNGFWKFDLEKGSSDVIKGTEGFHVSLQGYDRKAITNQGNIHSYYIEKGSKSILKLRDGENRTLFMISVNGVFKKVLPLSSDNITEIKISNDLKYVFSVEENYNLPSRLVYNHAFENKRYNKILDSGNIGDIVAKSMRQEMVSYSDSFGNPLKGTLYYPTVFDENKKYPMIVSIYMTQRTLSNEYNFPNASSIGFDMRTLLDRGYFIYLPDIVHSNQGSGMSALDCVNHSLDALSRFKNIDFTKVGLTGHSMGGFETNFIATKSNRFKAYIAGSAHADIIRSYFSLHYDTGLPYMWQYETGQHSINSSFSENKDIYFRNNPILNVEKVSAPMLLWTGKKDFNVLWDHTMEFYLGLMRNGKQAIALFYPEGFHNLGKDTQESRDLNRRTLQWWDYFLKDKTNIPWISKQIKKDAN